MEVKTDEYVHLEVLPENRKNENECVCCWCDRGFEGEKRFLFLNNMGFVVGECWKCFLAHHCCMEGAEFSSKVTGWEWNTKQQTIKKIETNTKKQMEKND